MSLSNTDLTSLGLNAYESAVYLALLARSGQAPSDLAARAKVPRQRIYDVLRSLETRGLITACDTSPRTFYPVDPATALPALSADRAMELERERERIAVLTQELAGRLAPLFQAGRSENDPLRYVEALSDPARIAARANELASAAKSHVNSLIKRPMILSSEQNRRFLHVPLEQGVRYRALYEQEALDDPELRGWMEELSRKGQQIRIVERLPVKMQAFDDEVALLSMQDPVGGPPSFTALAVRHRGAVALLNLAFERLWDEGTPYEEERSTTTMTTTAIEIEYVEGYRPGALGRIAEMHGVYYATAWGAGVEFEGMMAQEMREFLAHYQEGRDLLLTARVDGQIVGAIAVQGSQTEGPGARLRWVIVEEAYQGRGIGKELLHRALEFCQHAGFSRVFLWTVEGLPQSMALYTKLGFRVTDRFPDDRYSVPHMNLRMEKDLS
jgi:HTH-type transcriptional regulator, sugar sensing transcriptional regulator